ncbi:MAG: PIN domain-containing protein [Bacteroidales bacterium]|nr:PIN domain-containing protein [Bacteroidales bacterium]
MRKYLLDTNCFDYILDNQIELDELKSKGIFYTSNVQYSELRNIPNQERREAILRIYEKLEQIKLQLKSGIWIDDLYWDDEQVWNDNQTSEFVDLQKGNLKNSKDALIGELAVKNDILLVTSDKKFQNKCSANNIEFVEVQDLMNSKK